MARNGSGTMSIVNTEVAGQTITASHHNQNYSDIGSEITNSVAVDGQSTMTGPLKTSNGSAAAPSWTFGSDTDSGFYRITANSIGLALDGVLRIEFTTASISVILPINFAAAINIAAGAQNGLVGTPTYSFASDLDTGIYRIGANNLGVAAGGGKVIDITTASVEITGVFKATSFTVGSNPTAAPGKKPSYQTFTTGTAATYTTATGATYIKIRMWGAGGGGGGTGTAAGANGGTGGTTTFNSITAIGGSGGVKTTTTGGGAGGAGGTGGSGSTNVVLRQDGAAGTSGGPGTTAVSGTSNPGVGSPGAGAYGLPGMWGGAGGTGVSSGTTAIAGGGGGGNPEYVEMIIGAPAATYTYTVGAAGTAGTAGTSGNAGLAGSSGTIIVEEYYN